MRKCLLRPDAPDDRDFDFEELMLLRQDSAGPLPEEVDMREEDPEAIFDQLYLGSCASNAACALMSFLDRKFSAINAFFHYSRLFNYWETRKIQGTIDYDSGATIRDTLKAMHKVGCAGEGTFPYIPANYKNTPTQEAYDTAVHHKLVSYMASYWRIMTVTQLKRSLADGFPVMMGVEIYSSFESDEAARTGVIPMPDKEKEYSLGGHALLAMGYTTLDDGREYIICRNSWGKDWGEDGYCYIPMDFIGRYVTDMWTGR